MNQPINNFYELTAWQEARKLVKEIYALTANFPKHESYNLTSQLRRAAVSIAANIAEGFARYYFADKVRFYYQARASVAEVQNFLILAMDQNYINKSTCTYLGEKCKEVMQLVNGLIRSASKQKDNK